MFETFSFLFHKIVLRRIQAHEIINVPQSIAGLVTMNAQRVMFARRAQEIRFFIDQAEDESSALYTDDQIEDLLDRVHDSFNGRPEE